MPVMLVTDRVHSKTMLCVESSVIDAQLSTTLRLIRKSGRLPSCTTKQDTVMANLSVAVVRCAA
jgi:hypothetical protein